MEYYQPNPECRCGRCSTRGLIGPAVLVTLGLLFLLANVADFPFERTWPILLIVIGAIKVLRYVIPETGHLNPGQYPSPSPYTGPYPPPTYQVYPNASDATPSTGPIVTPPPAPSAGALGEGSSENGEVHHG